MNVMGWKTEEFELEYVTGEIVGYVFTIDGKPLGFDDFIPLQKEDIEEVDYLSDTKSPRKAPYVACCSCGIIGCNAVYTIVKFEEETVSWTVFQFSSGQSKKKANITLTRHNIARPSTRCLNISRQTTTIDRTLDIV